MKIQNFVGTAFIIQILSASFSQQSGLVQQHARLQLSLAKSTVHTPSCYDCQDDIAYFYEKDNFKGTLLQASARDKPYILSQYKLDNKITSFKLGKNVRVILCLDNSCEGAKWDRQVEVVGPYMTSNIAGNNDAFSSIKVFKYDRSAEPRVQVFSDTGYGLDEGGTFTAGRFALKDFQNHFIVGNSIGSLVVPENLEVTVFTKDLFSGESKVFPGPMDVDLIGALKTYNDNIESMVVTYIAPAKKVVDKIQGSWQKVTSSNGGSQFEVKTGITFATAETKTSTFGASLSVAAETGAEFLGAGAKLTVTASVSTEYAHEIQKSMESSKETTIQVGCNQGEGRQVALWQWQLQGVNSGTMLIKFASADYICKYGPDYLIAPACAFGFCGTDPQCRGPCQSQT